MIEIIVYGVSIGIMLSLMAGTVFFVLIETSIMKGAKAAIAFDLGVITSDLFYILLAFFGSQVLEDYINNNSYIYILAGSGIIAYGAHTFFDKKSIMRRDLMKFPASYHKLFIKGFILNLINISVLFFWITVVTTVGEMFNDRYKTLMALMVIIGTFFCIDLIKIYLSKKIKRKLRLRHILAMKRTIGFILFLMGLGLIVKIFF